MKNKSIIIIVSVLIAIVLCFLGGVVLLRVAIDAIQAEALRKLSVYDFPASGILLRYEVGTGIDDHNFENEDYEYETYNITNEDNYLITVYADGEVELRHFTSSTKSSFFSDPPVYDYELSRQQLEELKSAVSSSGIKAVNSEDPSYWERDNTCPKIIIKDGEAVISVSKNQCKKGSRFLEQKQSTLELFEKIPDLIGKEKLEQYLAELEEWKKGDKAIYDFSYNKNDYSSVSMFRYYEELYGTGDPANESVILIISLKENGITWVGGSYPGSDEAAQKRYEELNAKTKSSVKPTELKKIQKAMQDNHFEKYCKETPVGYEPSVSDIVGRYRTVRFLTAACNGSKYYIIDDGSDPEVRAIIDSFLEVVSDGTIDPDECYQWSDNHTDLSQNNKG